MCVHLLWVEHLRMEILNIDGLSLFVRICIINYKNKVQIVFMIFKKCYMKSLPLKVAHCNFNLFIDKRERRNEVNAHIRV